jgi:hypothetical protein
VPGCVAWAEGKVLRGGSRIRIGKRGRNPDGVSRILKVVESLAVYLKVERGTRTFQLPWRFMVSGSLFFQACLTIEN